MPARTQPALTELDAARVAAQEYGLEARASRLASELGQNFRLDARGGERFVLKLTGPGEPRERLDFENRLLEHLAAAGLPFATPRQVPATDGREVVDLPSGDRARLLTWLPGRPWAEVEGSAALRHGLGAGLARLDESLLAFTHPAAGGDRFWDLRHADRERRHVATIAAAARRGLVDDVLHRFAAYRTLYGATLRRSVIHGDANDHNLLVDGGRLSGLLDVGDAVLSWTVCDLAIALAYVMLERQDRLGAASEVVAGYHAIRPLIDPELAVLFPFATGRLAQSVVVAARRRSDRFDDPYLFVSEEPAWEALEALAGIEPEAVHRRFRRACGLEIASPGPSRAEILAARRRHLGPSLSLAYDEPLHIVRGYRQYLYDRRGRPYLDLVNNVCHVGHCHPAVVAAAHRQMSLLNTNTRYLYEPLSEYAERLCRTLPDGLEVCFFVNSGSEANELAIRLARTATGRRDLLVLDGAYHGHTTTLIDASPYKFLGPGGSGAAAPWVHMVPMPDGYRGPHRGRGSETGRRYAARVERAIAESERPIAAFLCEPVLGCGGQIVPPAGFLAGAYRAIREAGGLAIADEVQVGFGRVGSHFWAFETESVVPDIVVLGKPIGNGHPLGAVITTREIADAFANGMEFFATFGGNPVSCAVGLAVLDVIENERLQARAARLGERLLEGLGELQRRHPRIGDVRGLGLFAGVELVLDRETLEPATREAGALVDRLAGRGLLVSSDGPFANVLKIKPPMVLGEDDVDFFLRALDLELAQAPRP